MIRRFNEGKYFPTVADLHSVISFAEKCNGILPNSVIYSSGNPFSMKNPSEKLRKMIFKEGSLSGVVTGNFNKSVDDDSQFKITITLGSLGTPNKNIPDYNGDDKLKKVRFPLYIISKSSDRRGIFQVANLANDMNLRVTFWHLGVKNDWVKPNEFDVYLLQKWGTEISESKLRDMKNEDLYIIIKIEK